jgi:transcriptional regulator with XRE-family HTH domain
MALQRRSRASVATRARQRGPLAAVVSARRQELGLSQVDLGDLAGVSYRIVHNLEAGRTEISLERLLAVLATLGLHLSLARGAAPAVAASEAVASLYDLYPTEADGDGAGAGAGDDADRKGRS